MELNPRQKIAIELDQLLLKLEQDFNERDDTRFKQLRAEHLREPDFFRHWILYDRLVTLSMMVGNKNLKKLYAESQTEYNQLKHASEHNSFYRQELAAWKSATGID